LGYAATLQPRGARLISRRTIPRRILVRTFSGRRDGHAGYGVTVGGHFWARLSLMDDELLVIQIAWPAATIDGDPGIVSGRLSVSRVAEVSSCSRFVHKSVHNTLG